MTPAVSALAQLAFVNPVTPFRAQIPATAPRPLRRAEQPVDLTGLEVDADGRTMRLAEVLELVRWTSLMVVAGGEVVHEAYAAGLGRHDLFLGASMSKSALAHLVGRAVTDGRLDLAAPVADLVPELAASGFGPVPVRDVLRMTSGTDWVEDHRDPSGPASRLLACVTSGQGSIRELLTRVGGRCPPGRRWEYSTADSQVLDWVRERATGETFGTAMAGLWRDLGCTDDAVVATDAHGVALAGGALAAVTGDWVRTGMLQVGGLTTDGVRLLSTEWLDVSARPSLPITGVGRLPNTITRHAGFGGHWWPTSDTGERVMADGSRGQLTFVDRATGVIVTLTSCWDYDDPAHDLACRDTAYATLAVVADAVVPVAPRPASRKDPR